MSSIRIAASYGFFSRWIVLADAASLFADQTTVPGTAVLDPD
ncbi:hypothetical protein PAB09_12410 [Corynebacterium sp. SCR221107]|nr:hypothetical protein [Corynebacterium sp. SCR221107]WBT08644.1 hypothetical protein PAB09_12410 [Corynebacterium sp. SCR221107]